MATPKVSGLGDNFYLAGYDLSGDLASVDTISGPMTPLDVTAIKQVAHARIGGQRAGSMQFTSFFESTAGVVSPGVPASGTPVVSTYNFPVMVTVIGGTGTNVAINGVLQGVFNSTFTIPALGNITLTYTVAPTWNWFALGGEHQSLAPLVRTDVIATYFRGVTIGSPSACMVSKQINYDPTRDNSGNLTLKVQLVANAFGMEWGVQLTPGLRTDTTATTGAFFDTGFAGNAFGCEAYLQLIELVGTNVDVSITHATTSGGAYSTLVDFGSLVAYPAAVRVVTANNATVNEFVKVVTTGTFSVATFAVTLVRNQYAGQVY